MGWIFRKKIGIGKLLKLNVSSSGVSATIGVKGASVNIGKKGIYANAGIPRTGLYSRIKLTNKRNQKQSIPHEEFHQYFQKEEKMREDIEKSMRISERSSTPITIDDLSLFDPLFPNAVEYVINNENTSIYGLKSHFNIGYYRAEILRDQMIKIGILEKVGEGHPKLIVNLDAVQNIINKKGKISTR